MSEHEQTLPNELGTIKISDDVVAIIAGLAATEIEGVSAMSGGIAGGIAEVLGRRNLAKGVKVEVGTEECSIDLFVIITYGKRIPDVCWSVQENVKKAVENMTGLHARQINVHVQGIHFPQKEGVTGKELE